jgi:hypothetical protein
MGVSAEEISGCDPQAEGTADEEIGSRNRFEVDAVGLTVS